MTEPISSSLLSEALREWQSVVGAEHVKTGVELLCEVEQATFATSQRIPAILRPATREEVQACVRIANQYKVPLYPVSQGKNWGLGSRVPVQTGCVLMELSRLHRIVDFDAKHGTLTVEPGVTFLQAYEFLRAQQCDWILSTIGGSPHASLLGNTLERGDGTGPHGERTEQTCGLEVVLPTGEIVRTGFGRFASSTMKTLDIAGVGPALDGLFFQSNLGIVTEATIWLWPRPKDLRLLLLELTSLAQLGQVLDALRPLLIQKMLTSNCVGFWNAYKMIARHNQYPWARMEGKTPMMRDDLERLGPWDGVGEAAPWQGNIVLYSPSSAIGRAKRNLVEETLASLVSEILVFDSERYPDLLGENPFLGAPSEQNILSAYWRKTEPPQTEPMDPDREHCGALWLCPSVPLDGGHLQRVVELVEPIILEAGFEPNLGLNCPSGRRLRMYIALMYDRQVEGEDAKAMACHDRLLTLLMEAGYPPYRASIAAMQQLVSPDVAYGKMRRRIKEAFDPHGILAPGRYEF